MNWEKGLKRITFVLSIVGAVLAAGFFCYDAERVLSHNANILARERRNEFSELDESRLINEWKQAKMDTEQNELWLKWTGSKLSEMPLRLQAIAELQQRGVSLGPETSAWLQKKANGLDRLLLKTQGWLTANGEPLPVTPENVWLYQRHIRIKDLEETVWQNTIKIPVATAVGAIIGFFGVWVLYAVTKKGALPLYKWISIGFHEDKQKGLKKTNE